MSDASTLPRVSINGLAKSFSGVPVLHQVSFEAYGGRVLGVVGENGSGKSTTMNLLTGILQPDSGTISLDGELFHPTSRIDSDAAGVAFIQQELNIFPNLSVADNLFLLHPPCGPGPLPFISLQQMHARARALLDQVQLQASPTTLAGMLSAGERQLLEIARGLASRARVYIFDEPTSSLTTREIKLLFDIIRLLKANNAAILYISHNLEDILQLCDDVVVLRDGQVTLHRPTANLSARDLVLAMVGRPIEALFEERSPKLESLVPVLDVSGLGQPGVLENIHIRVAHGEIVGLAGLMGSGRSELARAIFGIDPHLYGAVRVHGKSLSSADVKARLASGVAFLTEDRRNEGLLMEASILDNMALAALPVFSSHLTGRVHRRRLLEAVHAIGERLRLKSGAVKTSPVRSLSGGNQQKVLLGRWLLRNPSLFILDEPTRGVDVGAKQEIYRLLAQLADSGIAFLIISSELEELLGICNRIHVMRRGELVAEFTREHFEREAILQAAFGQSLAA
jgi:ribose transport system ATP-binding protein